MLAAHQPSHDNSLLHAQHTVHTVRSKRRVYPVIQARARKSKTPLRQRREPSRGPRRGRLFPPLVPQRT